MAALEDNRFTVGLWPLPATMKRSNVLGNLLTPGVGSFELRPIPYENMGEAIASGDISSLEDYIVPYQTFNLTVKAIPTLPGEVVTGVSFKPPVLANFVPIPGVPDILPFAAIMEEPNATSPPLRTGGEEPVIPEPSSQWNPPLVEEPYILETISGNIDGAATITLSGYYTEKAWYDRSWILRYSDCIASISGDGVKYIRTEDIPKGVPLDPEVLFADSKIAKQLPSSITPATWYPATKADAEMFDAPEMVSYLSTCEGIISYKATEIKKLRFSYMLYITSTVPGTTLPVITPVYAFMTVQYNSRYAEQRLQYALNIEKKSAPLLKALDA